MTTSDNTYDARTGILLVDQLSPAAEAKLKRLARLTGKLECTPYLRTGTLT